MNRGERFRGTGSGGVAQFLAGHQGCDAGFDVTRERGPGSGRLKIVCKGCGESVEYKAAEARGVPRIEVDTDSPAADANGASVPQAEAQPTRSGAGGPGGEPAAKPPPAGVTPPPGAFPRERAASASRRRPRTSSLAIGALIVAGLAMILVGLVRSGDDEASSSATVPATGSQKHSEPAPRLTRRRFRAFSIGVPKGWRQSVSGGAIVFSAPGAAARLRIYFQSGERSVAELAPAAASYLSTRHPGATVKVIAPVRIGGVKASRLRADYGGARELALLFAAGGYSYLELCATAGGADPQVRRDADAACASIRPA